MEHVGNDGLTYRSLRFTAYRKRRFVALGALSAAEAQRELRGVLADVERGTWQPPAPPPPEPEGMPTFHEFSEGWWVRNQGQLRETTQAKYKWALERHLLPYFAERPLDQISFDLVERYIAAKLGEREALSASSINGTVMLMAAILEGAVERELIARNPARGRGRRVRERPPQRTHLETAEQISALISAAGELDKAAREDHRHVRRRAIIATLVFGGLRIGELCSLRWRDVDLAAGWLRVGEAKTDAGVRSVKIRGALRDELLAIRRADADPSTYVFATRTGGRPSRHNIRSRVLAPAVERASARLVKRGATPLPDGLTPHSLRRTFASVLVALGEDPGVVMDEIGHTDPGFTLRVYRQTMRRGDDEKENLRTLVEGRETAVIGSWDASSAPTERRKEAA